MKMLAGGQASSHNQHNLEAEGVYSRFVPPTEEQAAHAVDAVRNQAGFVGVTDLWDLSVCLYRKRFGGSEVTQLSFRSGRASSHRGAELMVMETLRRAGWEDRKELRVYRAALQRVLGDACNETASAHDWCATLARPEADECAAHAVAAELAGPGSALRAHQCVPSAP